MAERQRELEAALAVSLESAEGERQAAAARERELSERLGEALAMRLGQEVKDGLMRLQTDIETAVVDALGPFLEQEACRRSAVSLGSMIAQSLADISEPLIEVRAPQTLHGVLKAALAQTGVTIDLNEGPHVELAIGTRVTQFEDLAARWIEVLAGHAT